MRAINTDLPRLGCRSPAKHYKAYNVYEHMWVFVPGQLIAGGGRAVDVLASKLGEAADIIAQSDVQLREPDLSI